MFKSISFA